ncbi:MAG: TetR family transcriptional regulator [Nevskia sp.]|nr:TetR family transcriptional regulator [Nevskia sp.]
MPAKPRKPAIQSSPPAEAATPVNGRRRLMQAALRVGAQKRGLQALGLRELAREAGLNPNTFYRHFDSLDDLGLAIIEELGRDLRTTLRGIRRTVSSVAEVSPRTIEFVFDYARANPEGFIVAVRELHGTMPAVREALQRMIADVAEEMVEDVLFLDAAPGLELATLREISIAVVQQVFLLTLDYLEHPERREQMLRRTVRFIDMLFAGALTMQTLKVESLADMLALQTRPK